MPVGAWHYPEMRTEVTVTTTGSFAASVTLGFSLTAGLTLDAHFSADFEIVSSELTRTDWIYWETETDGTNTYREQGYAAVIDTTTYTFAGNLDDGFEADLVQDWRFHGDVSSEGTRHVGPPPTPPAPVETTNAESILDGVQLGLDIAGLIPGLGEPLDAINAGINLARGNYGDAALSLAAMYPFGGQAATATKLGRKAGAAVLRNLDKADEGVGAVHHVVKRAQEAAENLSCFPAGTPVHTESGLRAIETVQVGDCVWAFDLVAGEWSLQSVLRTFVRDYDHDAVVITVAGEEITSTQLHPFWVIDGSELEHRPVREHLYAPPEHSKLNGRWVDAVDLRPGDTVFLQATGPTRIEAVRTDPANYPVYNFAVDGLKCYTVGRSSVLVHNSNGVELPGSIAPTSRGSTANLSKGTTLPRNLREQLAVEEVVSRPSAGQRLPIRMNDPRWMAADGWAKMQQIVQSGGREGNINVHYVYNCTF